MKVGSTESKLVVNINKSSTYTTPANHVFLAMRGQMKLGDHHATKQEKSENPNFP